MNGIVPAMNHACAAPTFTAGTGPGRRDQQMVRLAREGPRGGEILSSRAGLWSYTREGPPRFEAMVSYMGACTYIIVDEQLDGTGADNSPAFYPG